MNELPAAPQPQPFAPPAPLAVPSLIPSAAIGMVLVGGLFFTAGALTQVLSVPVGMWFSELAVFAVAPLLVLRAMRIEPLRAVGFDGFSPQQLLYGFAVGAVNFFAVAMPLQWLSIQVFPRSVVKIFDTSQFFANLSGPELWVTAAAVSFAAPVCEEIAFRGLLNRALLEKFKPWAAVLVGGFVFSVFHGDPVGFAARWALGALFGWLAWRSGSIWAGVGAHCGNNLTSMVLYLLSPAPGSDDATGKDVAMTFVVAAGALSVLLQLPKRFPVLLSSPRPAQTLAAPARGMALPIFFWLLAFFVTVSAVLGIDPWGAALGRIDAADQVRFDDPKDPDAVRLNALRAKVRHGDGEIGDYKKLRKEMAKAHPLFELAPKKP